MCKNCNFKDMFTDKLKYNRKFFVKLTEKERVTEYSRANSWVHLKKKKKSVCSLDGFYIILDIKMLISHSNQLIYGNKT